MFLSKFFIARCCFFYLISASLSGYRVERKSHLSDSLCVSVGRSVRKVYCGKTADLIRISFGVMRGVGRGMGVLDKGGDRRRGRGQF